MTVTAEAWSNQNVQLISLSVETLEVLQKANMNDIRVALSHYKVPSDYISSINSVRTWKRRHGQVLADLEDGIWVTRLVILQETKEVIGRAGFHAKPDETGMVEIGYAIDPLYRRMGHGKAIIQLLLDIAKSDPRVSVVRASVGVTNSVSRGMIVSSGFEKVGEEMDDEDGLEEVFELSLRS